MNPEDVRIISPGMCPFSIIDFTHWREDGTCRCNCASHRRMMMNDWGYTPEDFRRVGVIA